MKTIKFKLTAFTDPAGKWNENAPKKGNEDDLFVDADLSNEVQGEFLSDKVVSLSEAGCLMVVADGMGGMNAGEVASSIAIETVMKAFAPGSLSEDVMASARSRTQYLERVVVDADAAIKGRAKIDMECEGMGSTIIMAWLYGNELTVTWCGDSRAYLFRECIGIRQISKDHSYVQSLVDDGTITEAIAFDHPYNNIITRSLGDPEKKAVPDSVTIPVYQGDIILLCSDGLNGVLRDRKTYDEAGSLYHGENIEDIIRGHRDSMVACREALWAAAERADWYDNVTAILCGVVEGDAVPENLAESERVAHVSSSRTVTRSFIKVRKSTLRNVAVISLAVVFLIVGAIFMAPRLKNTEKEDYKNEWQRLDSIAREKDMRAVMLKLKTVKDSYDTNALNTIESDLIRRVELIDSLNARIDKIHNPDTYQRYMERICNVNELDSLLINNISGERVSVTSGLKVKDAREPVDDEVEATEEKSVVIPKVKAEDIQLHPNTGPIDFMIREHKALPGVGLDSLKRQYVVGTFTDAVVLDKEDFSVVTSLMRDAEYYVVAFSVGTYKELCSAIAASKGRLAGLTPDGFTPEKFYDGNRIVWSHLPKDEVFTVKIEE